MIAEIEQRLRAFQGPLTEELVRQPGAFGLGQVPEKMVPDAVAPMVCGFCSTGCSLDVHLRKGEAVNLTPNRDYPVNLGMACPKGWEALTPLNHPERGTAPLLRDPATGDFRETDWETAAATFCERLKRIQAEHGPESVAFLGTGQITTEEMALLGTFAKFEMGVVHGDGNTRQCMATAVSAYKESFGFDAPPYTYADFEESDVIVLIGSNLCIAHPIMWQRILRNPHSPEIIVIDPRKTETAMQATKHVPLRPKSDLHLLYGLAHLLICGGWADHDYIAAHTSGFEAFSDFVFEFDPVTVSDHTGLSVAELHSLAEKIGRGDRVSFWWTMGVNQSHEGTRTAQAIINLALMTGNMGRPGTGANSITGQCNAMGSRLFSNTSSLLGGRDFGSEFDRNRVGGILGIDPARIPRTSGRAYDQIIDGIEEGKIRALWVIATNGAHSWIDQNRFRGLLDKLDFLVVQDMYHSTETARTADLFLPAAGWGEKDGTLINSERRIGNIRKLSRAPGDALSDFSIFRLLASAWGAGNWLEKWSSPEAAFELLKELSRGMPCDFTGIDGYEAIHQNGGIQWPVPENQQDRIDPERRLFEDGRFFTVDQRARFVWDRVRSNPEPASPAFPFILLTGRGSSAQWHTLTRTGKSEILEKLDRSPNYVEIHPEDAAGLGVAHGDTVTVSSRRGSCRVVALLTRSVQRGQVFMPMHFEETNRLTRGDFDPHSRQPSYKSCAVAVTA